MYQHGENIVLAPYYSHVITELRSIAAISVLRVEHGIDEWYQRCLVNILVSHDVTEIIIAFIDVHTHRSKSVAGVVSLHNHCKWYIKKMRNHPTKTNIFINGIISLLFVMLFQAIRHTSTLHVDLLF